MLKAKQLPRAEGGQLVTTFTAGGNKYRWLAIDEIDVRRWTELNKLLLVLHTGLDSYKAIADYMQETQREVMKPWADETALRLYVVNREQTFLDNIVSKSTNRFHIALKVCALLAIREDDDIRKYSAGRLDEYVEDWQAEGYAATDFFSIAGSLSSEFVKRFRQTQARIDQTRERLMDVTVTK